eukprot:4999942-Pyramimonas_sp.AAC.1
MCQAGSRASEPRIDTGWAHAAPGWPCREARSYPRQPCRTHSPCRRKRGGRRAYPGRRRRRSRAPNL